MMFGFKASSWPLATTGSVGKKVPSVALRPGRPSWKSIAGEQVPKETAPEALALTAAALVQAAKRARRTVDACILVVGGLVLSLVWVKK